MVSKIQQLEDEWLSLEREGEDLEHQVEETIKKNEKEREKQLEKHQTWVSATQIMNFSLYFTYLQCAYILDLEGRSETQTAGIQKWDRSNTFHSSLIINNFI